MSQDREYIPIPDNIPLRPLRHNLIGASFFCYAEAPLYQLQTFNLIFAGCKKVVGTLVLHFLGHD